MGKVIDFWTRKELAVEDIVKKLEIIHDERLNIYKCPLCDFATEKHPGIHIHLTRKHPEWNEQKERRLQEWRAEHPELNTRDHKCPQCDSAFGSAGGLRVHIYHKHKEQAKKGEPSMAAIEGHKAECVSEFSPDRPYL